MIVVVFLIQDRALGSVLWVFAIVILQSWVSWSTQNSFTLVVFAQWYQETEHFFIRAGKACCMYKALLSPAGNWSKSETPLAVSWLSLFYCKLLFFSFFYKHKAILHSNSSWFQPFVTLEEWYGPGLMGLDAQMQRLRLIPS